MKKLVLFALICVSQLGGPVSTARGQIETPGDPIFDLYIAQAGTAYALVSTNDSDFFTMYDSLTLRFIEVYLVTVNSQDYTSDERQAILESASDAALKAAFSLYSSGWVDMRAFGDALDSTATENQGINGDPGRSNIWAWFAVWYAYYAYLDLQSELNSTTISSP